MRSTTDSALLPAPSPSSLSSESFDCSISRIASFTSAFSTTGTLRSRASAVERRSTPSRVLKKTNSMRVNFLDSINAEAGQGCYEIIKASR